ncbi:hypothetical protein SCHPADRAFT_453910 [Schizopora paradoxa]|uniref:G-protein coupled receptors family 3 profile domain-containing protein n=1 Tax=Schizopora paradoxa TaxID=27342 RepID=A0A0H2RIH2_9AGAM|nr:hypothetical protein SCHPADRAFT_453910 [Schizopora paradoxa]
MPFELRLPFRCEHFVRFEGAVHCVTKSIAGLIMIHRTYALHGKSKHIVYVLGSIWVIQVGSLAFFLSGSQKAPEGCTLIHKESRGFLEFLSYVPTMVFDTAVLGFTSCGLRGSRQPSDSGTWRRRCQCPRNSNARSLSSRSIGIGNLIQNQTIHYYCVISITNLTFGIMMVTAPPGIRNVVGQLAEVLTVTMMSRLCIDIRKVCGSRFVVSSNRSLQVRTASPLRFAENEEIELDEFHKKNDSVEGA